MFNTIFMIILTLILLIGLALLIGATILMIPVIIDVIEEIKTTLNDRKKR